MSTPTRSPLMRDRSAHEAMLARERAWAARAGVATDAADQLVHPGDGLCFVPSNETPVRLARHPDRPLGESGKHGAVDQLGSAWALACNVIEAIADDALGGLLDAVGAAGSALRRSLVHPGDALAGEATRAPVYQIDRESGGPLFIEVHGASLAQGDEPDLHALPDPETGWGDLEGCRRLAGELDDRFAPIPLASTLRRVRSITRSHGRRGFRYVVLRPHFDRAHDAKLRGAFDAVRMRIGGEVDFDAIDVSTLHARLSAAGPAAHPALGWLADRYLDNEAHA